MRADEPAAGSSDLHLDAKVQDTTAEVEVAGDLDMAAAFKFETRLDALLATKDVRAVALDLSSVGFMDSAGLGALLAVRDRAQDLGKRLTLAQVSDAVRRTLEVTGLGGITEA
jgi:anti-anti-sigma factor